MSGLISMVDEVEFLKDEIKKLNERIKKMEEAQKINDNLLESYYTYLNYLYLDYDLKPKGVLKDTQDLCLLLLDFVSSICLKYDLDWWLDYGNLLGAIRHNGFIPWDDDMDIGMTRKDCFKLLEVLEDEIKTNNLDDIIYVTPQKLIRENSIIAFTQISVKNEGRGIYAGLDIFPIDFIDVPPNNIAKTFYNAKCEYHKNLIKGMDKKEVVYDFYERYNMSFEYQKFFLPSIECYWGNSLQFKLFPSDTLFPLRKIEFNGKLYPCPNNPEYFVSSIYGKNYRKIPKNLDLHGRLKYLRAKKNVDRDFKELKERLEEVNEIYFSEILSSKNILFFQKNVKSSSNINQTIPIEHVIKFNMNRLASDECRCYIQIGDNWNNSVFIGQIGAGNTFGIWLRKDGVTDYHNVPVSSNTYLNIEYSFKDGFHTLKVDDVVVSVIRTDDYNYSNLLNIVVDENAIMTDLSIL